MHILCPVDFSDASRHAVEQAIALARWDKGRITALHVYPPMFLPVPGLPAPIERVSHAELQRTRAEVAAFFQAAVAARVDVDVEVVVGHPASEILERASRTDVQMIVMGTHGAAGFEHFVLGSVTEKVLRKARCAVVTVPPKAGAAPTLPFRHLLCAIDFSDSSLAGLRFARSLAETSGARMTVVHALEWPWHEPPSPLPGDLPPQQAAALTEFRRYLEKSATDRLAAVLADYCPNVAATPLIVHGKPHVELLRVAERQGADLIVMGVRGRNPIDLLLLGSTTNQVVRRATCPVATIRG